MMPAVVAVTTAECLCNRMPFSLLRFTRPLLLRPQFSYQPLTFISSAPTLAPHKTPLRYPGGNGKSSGRLRKGLWRTTQQFFCLISSGCESLAMRATDEGFGKVALACSSLQWTTAVFTRNTTFLCPNNNSCSEAPTPNLTIYRTLLFLSFSTCRAFLFRKKLPRGKRKFSQDGLRPSPWLSTINRTA